MKIIIQTIIIQILGIIGAIYATQSPDIWMSRFAIVYLSLVVIRAIFIGARESRRYL